MIFHQMPADGTSSRPPSLHVFHWDPKFFPTFHGFLRTHFPADQHSLVVEGAPVDLELPQDVVRLRSSDRIRRIAEYWTAMSSAKRVVLHGIFDFDLRLALALRPGLARKCSWVPWGGDLYWATASMRTAKQRLHRQLFRRAVSQFSELLTYLPADDELARTVLGFRGRSRRCLMYDSNIASDYVLSYDRDDSADPGRPLSVFVGNSATPTCRHDDAFTALLPLRERGAKIYCALNYGDPAYRQRIIDEGHRVFGRDFIPLTQWMARSDFEALLSNMDLGVFAHERQQGMGTAIAMFGLGKQVLLRAGTSQSSYFGSIGLRFAGLSEPVLTPLSPSDAELNRAVIREHHSAASHLQCWESILL